MHYRQCVSVIVLRQSPKSGGIEVLIVHKPRRRDAWQIPQGGIESGESIEKAAMRELEEETNIRLPDPPALTDFTYVYDYPATFIKRENPKYDGQELVFVTSTVTKDIQIKVDGRELDGYKWVSPKSLWKYLRRKRYRLLVEDVIQHGIRTHFPAHSSS